MRGWSISMALAVALAGAFACHPGGDVGNDGPLVGGSCRDSGDCVDRCVKGGDFPGGTCTVECRDDGDCPEFTYCVDKEGGVCLLSCEDGEECRGSYGCHDTDREGAGGKIHVCIH
jgi:hypothetical protein